MHIPLILVLALLCASAQAFDLQGHRGDLLLRRAARWLALIALALVPQFASAFDLQGHRGARGLAPENTLPAFAKALRLGVDYVEFDVRTTSDGKFYLLHDSTLNGKTDGQGPIADTPSSVIAKPPSRSTR